MTDYFNLSITGKHESKEYAKIAKKVLGRTTSPTVKGPLQCYAAGVTEGQAKEIIRGWRKDLGGNTITIQGSARPLSRFTDKPLRVVRTAGFGMRQHLVLNANPDKSVTEMSSWMQSIQHLEGIPVHADGLVTVQVNSKSKDVLEKAHRILGDIGGYSFNPEGTALTVHGTAAKHPAPEILSKLAQVNGLERVFISVRGQGIDMTITRSNDGPLSVSLSERHP